MTKTILLLSPACENDEGQCPYLSRESDCAGPGYCWAGDDEETREGCPPPLVDNGDGEMPRWCRNVQCPWGTKAIRVTVAADGE